MSAEVVDFRDRKVYTELDQIKEILKAQQDTIDALVDSIEGIADLVGEMLGYEGDEGDD